MAPRYVVYVKQDIGYGVHWLPVAFHRDYVELQEHVNTTRKQIGAWNVRVELVGRS